MIDVVIDCDPGIDDAIALMLAAGSPELHLLAVTCVAGNRPLAATTANAARLLALMGRSHVPVHAGCARPMAHAEARTNLFHGEDGLGGATLPEGRPHEALHAVDHLAALLNDAPPGQVTLIATGPLTNLALAEVKHPGTLRRAKQLLVMGGAVFCPGNVNEHAEFNFHADALAAHVVLGAGAPLTLFGLDVTSQVAMPADWIESFAALPGRSAAAAHAMLRAYASADPLLHDACPVAFAIEAALFGGEHHALAVDWAPGPTEGRVRALPAGAAPGGEVITRADTGRVLALVRERIATLP